MSRTDLDLHLVLTFPMTLQIQGPGTDRDAIIRLAVQLLDLQPSATARNTIVELVRAGCSPNGPIKTSNAT